MCSSFRSNVIQTLKSTLQTRWEGLSLEEKAGFPPGNTPEYLATQIEEEMTELYDNHLYPEYRKAYMRIFLNFKNVKTYLFRDIFQGTVPLKDLVEMETDEMDAAELKAVTKYEREMQNLEQPENAQLEGEAKPPDLELLKEDGVKIITRPNSVDRNNVEASDHNPSPSDRPGTLDSLSDSGPASKRPKPDLQFYESTDPPELPSSTTSESKNKRLAVEHVPVFCTEIVLHNKKHIRVAAFHISHNNFKGQVFPKSPVPLVGRIYPDAVWDFLVKITKTMEVLVFHLIPETNADREDYMSCFKYLSSRGVSGVIGAIVAPVKVAYLLPLHKQQQINPVLLQFISRHRGVPNDREDCLVAVIVRYFQDTVKSNIKHKKLSSSLVSLNFQL